MSPRLDHDSCATEFALPCAWTHRRADANAALDGVAGDRPWCADRRV